MLRFPFLSLDYYSGYKIGQILYSRRLCKLHNLAHTLVNLRAWSRWQGPVTERQAELWGGDGNHVRLWGSLWSNWCLVYGNWD